MDIPAEQFSGRANHFIEWVKDLFEIFSFAIFRYFISFLLSNYILSRLRRSDFSEAVLTDASRRPIDAQLAIPRLMVSGNGMMDFVET
jgi:hypothetical protein